MNKYYGYLVHLLPQPNLLCFKKLIKLLHLVQVIEAPSTERFRQFSQKNLEFIVFFFLRELSDGEKERINMKITFNKAAER